MHSVVRCSGFQFGLTSLLGFVTVCAILAALSPLTGIAASICLALLVLSLAARRGLLTLVLFAAASIAADLPFDAPRSGGILRQLFVILIAGAICSWFYTRRLHRKGTGITTPFTL